MIKIFIISFFIFNSLSFVYSQSDITAYADSTREIELFVYKYNRLLNRGTDYRIEMIKTDIGIIIYEIYKYKDYNEDYESTINDTFKLKHIDYLSNTFKLLNELACHHNLTQIHMKSFGAPGIKPIGLIGFFIRYSDTNELIPYTYLNIKNFIIYGRINRSGMKKINRLAKKSIREMNYIIKNN
jgi:hypothetical protein